MKMSDLLNPVGRTRSRSDFLSAQICATTACSLDQNLALGLYSTQSSWYCAGWTWWSLRTTGVGPSVFDEISSSERRWDKNVAAMPLATAWGICILRSVVRDENWHMINCSMCLDMDSLGFESMSVPDGWGLMAVRVGAVEGEIILWCTVTSKNIATASEIDMIAHNSCVSWHFSLNLYMYM